MLPLFVRTKGRVVARLIAGLRWRALPYVDALERWFEQRAPLSVVLGRRFRRVHGRRLDWRHPRLFSEKLYWIMRYARDPIMTQLADKYAVRDFVAARVGSMYLNELYAVWNRADDIDFDALPTTFALKPTHASGMVLFRREGSALFERGTRETIARWLRVNHGLRTREWAYVGIPPRIIAENLLDNDGRDLYDYKFFCFGGEPLLIQFDADRFAATGHRRELFTPRWERTGYRLLYPPPEREPERPKTLDEMLYVARRLSRGFAFVRVDLYSISGRVVFGEMTWYPEGGWGRFEPAEAETALGAALQLPRRGEITHRPVSRATAR